MWSRDTILSLRLVSSKLDTLTRPMVARAGSLRRGWLSSVEPSRSLRPAASLGWRVAVSETDTTAEIPVLTTRRHNVWFPTPTELSSRRQVNETVS